MGGYDHLCIVCGIAPNSGTPIVHDGDDIDDLCEDITTAIAQRNPDMYTQDIHETVYELLELVEGDEWKPDALQGWEEGFGTAIAIGHFDTADGRANLIDDASGEGEQRFPTGKGVQTRRVTHHTAGDFEYVLEMRAGPNGETEERRERITSHTSARFPNPNFFVSEACYRYIEAWISWDALPVQNPDVQHTPSLDMAGELYEIVNSRTKQRDRLTGVLPYISYNGLERSCDQYQDRFPASSNAYKWIGCGIDDGLQGSSLIPHLMEDFSCWMFMRPDSWPTPPPDNALDLPSFTPLASDAPVSPQNNALTRIPKELLDMIAGRLTFRAYFALSATCKPFRRRMCDPNVLDHVAREMLLHGPLQWILPVSAVKGSAQAARAAAEMWIGFARSGSGSASQSSAAAPFYDGDFPAFAFVDACFRSDSMRNRRRIYGQVKQFEALWREFRVKGWAVDRFHRSS